MRSFKLHIFSRPPFQEEIRRETGVSADVLSPIKQSMFLCTVYGDNHLPHRPPPPVFILPNITQICWPISSTFDSTSVFSRNFVQTGEQRGRRTHSSSPMVPQDNSETVSPTQRSFSHYQVTEFITHQRICPQDKAPGKKIIRFYSVIYGLLFHYLYYHLPNLRTKSWVLPLPSRR